MLFNFKPAMPSKSLKVLILQGFVTGFLFAFFVHLGVILGCILKQRATSTPFDLTLTPSDLEHLEDFTFLQDIKAGQLDETLKAVRAIEKFNKLANREKLESFQWRPLASKFEGVQEYLELTDQNGTYLEKFLYMSTPTFHVLPRRIVNATYTLGAVSTQHQYHGERDVPFAEWKIARNGLLYIENHLNVNGTLMKITTWYYIPVEEMLKI